LITIGKLHPVAGEDGMDFIGYGFDQHLEEGGGGQFGCLAVYPGEHKL
jgi:hypothetical protein